MNREDIVRMAREAGLYVGTNLSGVQLVGSAYEEGGCGLIHMDVDELERFASLVAAAEREACAKVVDSYKDCEWIGDPAWELARDAAEEIRARGEA